MVFDFTKFGNRNWTNQEEAEENFGYYFETHYLPLMNKAAESPENLTVQDKILLGFMRDDFTKMFNKE